MIKTIRNSEDAKEVAKILKKMGILLNSLSKHYHLLELYCEELKDEIIQYENNNILELEYQKKLARKKVILKRTNAILTLLKGYIENNNDDH